ncbi:ParA family protein [Streptomyces sp. NP160]|nr:ParA family protein [Streptomyces sp. NP160]
MLAQAIPDAGEDTPLARQAAEDARRRIRLRGRTLPKPPQTRVLTVANQKGGVGKTTSAVNLAAALAQCGLQVLVLDVDPQGNASTALGVAHEDRTPGTYEVLVEGLSLSEAVRQCPDVRGLEVCPASIDLAGAEMELATEPDMVARVSLLSRALADHVAEREQQGRPRLDYVLLDCPPSLGLITLNALVAAREVLIPIQCEYYALEGLTQLRNNIGLVQRSLNPQLEITTILLTMYDARTRLAREVADEVRRAFPTRVLDTTIPRSVRISEAPSHGETVMTYDPGNSGALSYLQAARELVESHHARLQAAGPAAEQPASEPVAEQPAREPAGEAVATGEELAPVTGHVAPTDQPTDQPDGRLDGEPGEQPRDEAEEQPATVVDLRTGPLDLRGSWTPDRSTASRRRAAERRA